jgi:glycosyltransferase involved in cell wall biosynthesis
MRFSLLIPTRNRPKLLRHVVRSFCNMTKRPEETEILIAYDNDDTQTIKAALDDRISCKLYQRDRINNLQAYFNWLSQYALGRYLFVLNDDCIMQTANWDEIVWTSLENSGSWYGITSPAGRASEDLYSEFPIISVEAVKKLGYVMPESYPGHGADHYIFLVYREAGKTLDLRNIDVHHFQQKNDETNKHMVAMSQNNPPIDFTEDVNKLRA